MGSSDQTLGLTGGFPQGRLVPDDTGELRLAVSHTPAGKVVVQFGASVEWLGMDPAGARAMAKSLNDHADKAEGRTLMPHPKDKKNWTRGIAPAQDGALAVLQHTPHGFDVPQSEDDGGPYAAVMDAAHEIARHHQPKGGQADSHEQLSAMLADMLIHIVRLCPAGPERSTAISRAQEMKFWASAAIARE